MNKTYVKMNLDVINASFKQTDSLYGIPSPLVYMSFLKAIEFRVKNSITINPGVMISYRYTEANKGKDFHFIQKGTDIKSTGLVDIPRGGFGIDLIFEISYLDTFENMKFMLTHALKKMRIAGGVIENVEIDYNTNIEEIKRSIGFTQYKSSKEFESGVEFIFESLVFGSFKKGLSTPAILGYLNLGNAGKENSLYKKDHFFAEPLIQMTEFKFLRKLNKSVFNEYAWFSELDNNNNIKIKTGETK